MAGHGRFGGHFVQVRQRGGSPLEPAEGKLSFRPTSNQANAFFLYIRLQGHVDTTAKIVSKVPDGDSIRMLFSLPLEFFTPMIPKGYVALDGTSLTLTHLSTPRTASDAHFDPSDPHRGVFGVMLIAHTQSRTVVAAKEVGDTVNVECDIVGKGVESVVRNVLEGGGASGGALEQMIERVVGRVLVEKGLVKQ